MLPLFQPFNGSDIIAGVACASTPRRITGGQQVNHIDDKNNELLEEQIDRRRKRGTKELAKITNQGKHAVYSRFHATSTSGQSYTVQIRSLTERFNTCTCPDYRTNTIGTCKHIEGVIAYLKKEFKDQWKTFIAEAPPISQVYVHHAERITVRTTLPRPRSNRLKELLNRYFDAEGVLLGNAGKSLATFLDELHRLPARNRERLHVDPEVEDYLSSLQDIKSTKRQKNWFLKQVENGNRSLNVLSSPLYPYQQHGMLHLTFGRRTLLADDMGLGKTIQAIAASAMLKQLRDIQYVLIVTPASLKHQWAREIRRFSSLSVQVIEGSSVRRRELYRNLHFFNIINYELLRLDEKEIAGQQLDLVILDEAQRIKNWRTKTADAVKRVQSAYAFVLTGTPLENRLDELYSIFQFIDPNILGPLWRFNQRYYVTARRPTGSYKVLGYKNLDELRRRIAPFIMRRVRDEVLLDLPERIESNFFVEMTEPQLSVYREYEQHVAQLMSKAHRRPLTPEEQKVLLGSLVKMRVICNALALHDPDIKPKDREKTAPKLRELREILSEEVAGNDRKAIIFSQWTNMLALVEPILEKLKLGWVRLTGDVPSKKRGALVERFFEDPDCRIFLSTDAGGLGLNLQAASMVINLDLPWNPAVLNQRIARAHRHGQSHTVNVVNLVAKGTIEERMLDTLAAKRAVFDAALNEDSDVIDLSFENAGQGVLQRLEVLIGSKDATEVELNLKPAADRTKETRDMPSAPTIRGFADALVGRYPGRIRLVRRVSQAAGISGKQKVIVVVDRDPAALRSPIETVLSDYFGDVSTPELLLMEQEGYRALSILAGDISRETESETTVYSDSSVPQSDGEDERMARKETYQKASRGFDQADKRLALASVVLDGGFPEETMRPTRQALGWALSSFLSIDGSMTPDDAIPAARLVEARLVVPGHIPTELSARLDRARALTAAASEEEEEMVSPGTAAAAEFVSTIKELVDIGRESLAKKWL